MTRSCFPFHFPNPAGFEMSPFASCEPARSKNHFYHESAAAALFGGNHEGATAALRAKATTKLPARREQTEIFTCETSRRIDRCKRVAFP